MSVNKGLDSSVACAHLADTSRGGQKMGSTCNATVGGCDAREGGVSYHDRPYITLIFDF